MLATLSLVLYSSLNSLADIIQTKVLVTSEDVHSHISKANRAFMQLCPVWRNGN